MPDATVIVEGDRKKVLLPPEVSLTEGAVDVLQVGDSVLLTPKKPANVWDIFRNAVGKAHDDFMPERIQAPQENREALE